MIYPTKTMILTVTVHRASALPVADVITSDPYVVVKLNTDHTRRTRTIERSLNPVWDESFDFPISSTSPLVLKFEVYDTDKNKDDDILGHFEISLGEFPVEEILKKSYKMTNFGKYNSTSLVTVSVSVSRSSFLSIPGAVSEANVADIERLFQIQVDFVKRIRKENKFSTFVAKFEELLRVNNNNFTGHLLFGDGYNWGKFKIFLECYYRELIDSTLSLKSCLSRSMKLTGTGSSTSSLDSTTLDQFQALIFYLMENNDKFVKLIDSKYPQLLIAVAVLEEQLLLSTYVDISALTHEYMFLLLVKMQNEISNLSNFNPSVNIIKDTFEKTFVQVHSQAIACYDDLVSNKGKCPTSPEIKCLSDFIATIPKLYYTSLVHLGQHLKKNANSLNLISAPRSDNFEETASVHKNQDDAWYCAVINLSAFILENPNEWKFQTYEEKETYEENINEVKEVFQELQDQANQQLASFIVHKVYENYLGTSADSSPSITSASRSSNKLRLSSVELYVKYQQLQREHGNGFKFFTTELYSNIIQRSYQSFRLWKDAVKTEKAYEALLMVILNKIFLIFYSLLNSCYEMCSNKQKEQSLTSVFSLTNGLSNLWIEDLTTIQLLTDDMKECLQSMKTELISPVFSGNGFSKSVQVLDLILELLSLPMNDVSKVMDVLGHWESFRADGLSSQHYSWESLERSFKVCCAIKGFYSYLNQYTIPFYDESNNRRSSSSVSSKRRPSLLGRVYNSLTTSHGSPANSASSPAVATVTSADAIGLTNEKAKRLIKEFVENFVPEAGSSLSRKHCYYGLQESFSVAFPTKSFQQLLLQEDPVDSYCCCSLEDEIFTSKSYFLNQSAMKRNFSERMAHPEQQHAEDFTALRINRLKGFNLLYLNEGKFNNIVNYYHPRPLFSFQLSSAMDPMVSFHSVKSSVQNGDRSTKQATWLEDEILLYVPKKSIQLLNLNVELKYLKNGEEISVGMTSIPLVSYLLPALVSSSHFHSLHPANDCPTAVSAAYGIAKEEQRPYPECSFSLTIV
jgi:hypothetical protein